MQEYSMTTDVLCHTNMSIEVDLHGAGGPRIGAAWSFCAPETIATGARASPQFATQGGPEGCAM